MIGEKSIGEVTNKVMIDYEILHYQVIYTRQGEDKIFSRYFDQEEIAVYFIKANRSQWSSYKLLQINVAIIIPED